MGTSDHPTLLGMPLPFERAEYERRFATVRRALEDAELDALLVFHQENMNYLFGYDQNGYWVYQVAVVTRERDDIVVLARPADHALIAGLPFVEDLRLWRDDSDDDPAQMTADILADVGALGSGRRVGIELHSHALLPYHHGRLHATLGGRVELVDASDLIADLRVRKSDAEVAYCRQAGEILDAALKPPTATPTSSAPNSYTTPRDLTQARLHPGQLAPSAETTTVACRLRLSAGSRWDERDVVHGPPLAAAASGSAPRPLPMVGEDRRHAHGGVRRRSWTIPAV